MIKVIRRFTYVVEGIEYSDQKAANAAAKEANQKEKQAIIAEIIQRIGDPMEAAGVIISRFHVYNKGTGRGAPGVKRTGKPALEERAS